MFLVIKRFEDVHRAQINRCIMVKLLKDTPIWERPNIKFLSAVVTLHQLIVCVNFLLHLYEKSESSL